MAQATLVERMVGAALLKETTYEDVEHDTAATSAALLVVILAALANGIGGIREGGFIGLIVGVISAIFGWAIYAGIAYYVGSRLLATSETRATWGQLLRTLGFAQAPGLLNILGILPVLGGLLRFIVSIWILVATIVAIRQACDFSTGRAVATAILSWIVYFVIVVIPTAFFAVLFGR